jgi:hypothetical protein
VVSSFHSPMGPVLKPARFRLTAVSSPPCTSASSMNALTDSAPTFGETCGRKIRCENRWTAAEDKVLFAQVLKGDFPMCCRIPVVLLTLLKPTAARSAGDRWLLRCQAGTISRAGRGTYLSPPGSSVAEVMQILQVDPVP